MNFFSFFFLSYYLILCNRSKSPRKVFESHNASLEAINQIYYDQINKVIFVFYIRLFPNQINLLNRKIKLYNLAKH